MKVKDIFDFLNSKYPIDTACDFDNPGILIGNPESDVSKVLISLDCTIDTVKNAVSKKCELIITHHPIIFNPLKNILSGTVAYEVVKNGISVISMHTNLDIGKDGVNDCLCKALEISNVETVIAHDGFAIKKGYVSPVRADDFAKFINLKLGGRVKYTDSENIIRNVLVCSGSGGEFLQDAKINNCDALVTSDVKHNYFIDAQNMGIAIFDAGHFETEDVIIEPLKALLQINFRNIEFHTDHTTKIKYA